MTDTSADAVERLAAGIISDVGAHYSPGAVIITTARTVREAAATLRALVAERDAAVERGNDWCDQAKKARAERDAAQRRLAAVFRAWAILHNTLNCIIHEEDNDPPDVANAIRIARNGLDEAGREMDAADMLAARSAALAEAPR